MLRRFSALAIPLLAVGLLAACSDDVSRITDPMPLAKYGPPNGGDDPTEGAGNNLSYPVVWAEGITKALRVPPGGEPVTNGEWWWWWGVIEGGEGTADVPLSCSPDPTHDAYCGDGFVPPMGAVKAYLQKDMDNVWQAGNVAAAALVEVDSIDWGDDLEAKDWSLSSMVRIEHVLYEGVATPMTEYVMRHVSGWGIDESHGLSVIPEGPTVESLDNYQPSVFSSCARLTIQRLIVPRESLDPAALVWNATTHQWDGAVINAPIFNKAVHEASDGPGYYNAEVNVKGKIIFGYTWGVRKLNQGAGDYRITFSLDATCGAVTRNTAFTEFTTIMAAEEEVVITEEPVMGGGTGVVDHANQLTYMDVRISSQKGGGGKKAR